MFMIVTVSFIGICTLINYYSNILSFQQYLLLAGLGLLLEWQTNIENDFIDLLTCDEARDSTTHDAFLHKQLHTCLNTRSFVVRIFNRHETNGANVDFRCKTCWRLSWTSVWSAWRPASRQASPARWQLLGVSNMSIWASSASETSVCH